MDKGNYPPEFLDLLKGVRGRRSKIVVEHILAHGHITSEELQRQYGYEHPPRAVRDVREQGIPIETFTTHNADGKSIAAYRFGDPSRVRAGQLDGRSILPKTLKDALLAAKGARCTVCLCHHEDRYLQVDHRVPFEVAGEVGTASPNTDDFMLLCASCNRAKSWSCEHCPNWLDEHAVNVCLTCYWASPEAYAHLAIREIRRLELVWTDDEVTAFERLKARAAALQVEVPDYVKAILDAHLRRNTDRP